MIAGADGTYSAGSPFANTSATTCSSSTKTKIFVPGDSGGADVSHEDGGEIFFSYGRSIHVSLNENYVELYFFAARDLDWDDARDITAGVTLTPADGGAPFSMDVRADFGRNGRTRVTLLRNATDKVNIRSGDSLVATIPEGPETVSREVSLAIPTMPMVTGSPDIDTSSLAGVAPSGWSGRGTMSNPGAVKATTVAQNFQTA